MDWIKRNLYFVIGSVVALLLLGAAGWYFYSSWKADSEALTKLHEQYANLKRLNSAPKFLAQLQIASNRSHFNEGLAFPRAPQRVVVGERARHTPDQRAAVPFGSQAEVDPVREPVVGVGRQHPHDLGDDAGKELRVRHRPGRGVIAGLRKDCEV